VRRAGVLLRGEARHRIDYEGEGLEDILLAS
jgi:hypothetical protein